MAAEKPDMIKECAEPPSVKLAHAYATVEDTMEKHDLTFEGDEFANCGVNYSSEIQESDADKENRTGIPVGGTIYKVKGQSESDNQKIDLKSCSLRKLKSLLREKMSNDKQMVKVM